MMKLQTLFVVFLFALSGSSQTWDWSGVFESSGYESANAIAIDQGDGSIYVGGVISNGVPFSDINSTNGLRDGFVAKLDSSGNVQWSFNIGGNTNNDEVTGITIHEATGRIYVTGYISGTFAMNGTSVDGYQPGSASGQISSNAGSDDIFVACYTRDGALEWVRTAGGANDDRGLDIAVNNNAVYVLSYFNTSANFGSLSTQGTNPDRDYAIASYDLTTGNELWLVDMGTLSDDWDPGDDHQMQGCGIAANNTHVYVATISSGSSYVINDVVVPSIASVSEIIPSPEDYVVTAFDINGLYVWSVIYDENDDEVDAVDIAVDCDGVYVCGTLDNGSVTPGGYTVVASGKDVPILSQLDLLTGNENWAFEISGATNKGDLIKSVTTDGYGNVYCVGRHKSAPFEVEPVPAPADYIETGVDGEDLFILRYQNTGPGGGFIEFESLNGLNSDWGNAIGVYKNTRYTIAGMTTNDITAPPTTHNSSNANNIFLASKVIPPVTGTCCPGPTVSSCAPDTLVIVGASCDYTLTDFTGFVTASDDCGTGTLTYDQWPAIGTTLIPGVYDISLSITDGNGNIATCVQQLTVQDSIQPMISCPGDQSVPFNASCQFTLADYTASAVTSDNCSGVVVSQSPAVGSTHSGTVAVTLTATDPSGNSSSCMFDVIPNDVTNPNIVCPSDVTTSTDLGQCTASGVALGFPMATDNCGLSSISNDAPAQFMLGTTIVTWTVQDIAGNSNTCTQNVTVNDTESPVVICPNDQNVGIDGNCDFIIPDYTASITGTDNCTTGLTLIQTPIAGTILSGHGTVQTIDISTQDASGNVGMCSFVITLTDTVAPTINNCPADTLTCDSIISWSMPTGSDDCGVVSVTQTQGLPPGSSFPVGITNIEYVIDDSHGNLGTCAFVVEVLPPINPTFYIPDTICLNGAGVINLNDSTQVNQPNEWDVFYSDSSQVSLSPQFNFQTQVTGAGTFPITHVVFNAACSDTLTQVVSLMPVYFPNFGSPDTVCASVDSVILTDWFVPVTDTGGIWSINNGGAITSDSIWQLSGQSGYFDVSYAVGEGQCMDTATKTVYVAPDVDASWQISPDTICHSAAPVLLNPLIVGTVGGQFYGQGVIGTYEFNPNGQQGNAIITYEVGQGSCSESDEDTIFVEVDPAVDAGPDIEVCDTAVTLSGQVTNGLGVWQSVQLAFIDSTNLNTQAISSSEGTFTITLTATNGYCSLSDDVVATFFFPPTIVDAGANQELAYQTESEVDAATPDFGSGMWSSNTGHQFDNPSSTYSMVSGLVEGENELFWTVTNGICPAVTDTLLIYVNPLQVPNGFSPNGDRQNEFFVIPGIENAYLRDLQVFNRWGQIVFLDKDYQNNWRGTDLDGKDLPADTYFYILKIDEFEYSGYVVIKR